MFLLGRGGDRQLGWDAHEEACGAVWEGRMDSSKVGMVTGGSG